LYQRIVAGGAALYDHPIADRRALGRTHSNMAQPTGDLGSQLSGAVVNSIKRSMF
jgi:hypothetical protein